MRIEKIKQTKRNCPLCLSKKKNNFFTKKNFYRIDAIGKVYKKDNIYSFCKRCLLVYQNPIPNEKDFNKIYANSVIGKPFEVSRKSTVHFDLFKKNVNKKFLNNKKKVLEVGTATGTLLKNITKYYNLDKKNVLGIEPSKKLFNSIKKNRYFNIKNLFLHNLKNKKFDFIILDNVFEHFDDPNDILKKLYALLNNDGKIYMSIPNILSTKYHLTDPLNHTCNYNKFTISKLLNLNSFKILSIKEQKLWINILFKKGMSTNHLDKKFYYNKVMKKKSELKKNESIKMKLKLKLRNLKKKINKLNSKVIFYGASNYGLEIFLRMSISKNLLFFVDSNPLYHGKKRIGFKVNPPSVLKKSKFDFIIISSQKFHNEIEKTILSLGIKKNKIIKTII